MIARNNLEFANVLHRKNNSNGQVYVDFFFASTTWSGEPTNKEPDKCDEVRWFNLNTLPENTVPFVSNAIESYRNGVVFNEDGWKQ